MKKLISLLLFSIITLAGYSQRITDKTERVGYTELRANGILHLPEDTILTIAVNATICDQLAKKNNVVYTYDCILHKWVPIAPAAIKALDSLRYDPLTGIFYSRYTTGGEIAIPTGFPDSLKANTLQRVMERGNISNRELLLDAGSGAGRLRFRTSPAALNLIYSYSTGATSFRPLEIATGGLMVSDRGGSVFDDDGVNALQVNGSGYFKSVVTGVPATAANHLTTRQQVTDSLTKKLNISDTATALANYLNNANSGLSRTGKTIQLGTNHLLSHTIIPLSSFSLNLQGSGKTTPITPSGNYRFNIIDSVSGYTSMSVRNLKGDGIASLGMFADSGSLTLGIKGSLSVVDTQDGFTARNKAFLMAGSRSDGFTFGAIKAGSDLIFKVSKDTILRLNKDTSLFRNQIGVGYYNIYPIPGEPAHVLDVTAVEQYLANFQAFSNNSGFTNLHFTKFRGTPTAPLPVLNGDFLFSLGARGWDGVRRPASSGAIQIFATEDFGTNANGTAMQFAVTKNGVRDSRTLALRLNNDATVETFADTKVNQGGLTMTGIHGLSIGVDVGTNYATMAHSLHGSPANTRVLRFDFLSGVSNGGWEYYNTSSSTSLMFIQSDGKVGIGNTAPTSTLQVNGSVAVKDTATTGSITLGAQTIVRVTNSAHVITLPSASTCRGRIYEITNETAGIVTVSSVIDYATGSGNTSILTHTAWRVYSDGTSWRLLSRSN